MRCAFPALPAALGLVFLVLPPGPLAGLPESLALLFRGNILLFPDGGNLPDPMPILPSLGIGADYPLAGPLYAEASVDCYSTNYDYSYTLDRAVPASLEYRSAFVAGIVAGFQLTGRFALTDSFVLRVFTGPAADLRLCFLSYGLRPDEITADGRNLSTVVEDVAVYFWRQGRWFLPVAGFGFEYRILPKIMLGLESRVWIPLYRWWSGEDLAPIEGWRMAAGFTISLR